MFHDALVPFAERRKIIMSKECPRYIKQTNADRIRNMSVEELAEFLLKVNTCAKPCMTGETTCKWKDYPEHTKGCKDCFMEWLNQEAMEENNMDILEKITKVINKYLDKVYDCSLDKIAEFQKDNESKEAYIVEGIWEAFEVVKDAVEEYNNDFCKWKGFDNSIDKNNVDWVYETTCGKYIGENHTSSAFKFCPYCSKKIKVIESKKVKL